MTGDAVMWGRPVSAMASRHRLTMAAHTLIVPGADAAGAPRLGRGSDGGSDRAAVQCQQQLVDFLQVGVVVRDHVGDQLCQR